MSDEQPKTPSPPTIAMLTAGAGNMYCGSCLQDNAVAAAMMAQGHDIVLVPTYTPIRTDDRNVSLDRVFLGGINVYLQQQFGFFRHSLFDRASPSFGVPVCVEPFNVGLKK